MSKKLLTIDTKTPKMAALRKKALKLMEQFAIKHLVRFHLQFPDFWKDYCNAFKQDYSSFMGSPENQKRAKKSLALWKSRYGRKIQTEVDRNNSIITHHTKSAVVKKNATKTIETINQSEIKKQEIKEISFASAITVSMVKQIEMVVRFQELLTKDYLYFIGGGTEDFEIQSDGSKRKRFGEHLTHLKTAIKIRHVLDDLAEKMFQEYTSTGSIMNSARLMKFELGIAKDLMENAQKVDLQSIKFINDIAEGQFSIQKALQGAIVNDRALVDNGQAVLNETQKTKEVSDESISHDLKLIASDFNLSHLTSADSEHDDSIDILHNGAYVINEQEAPKEATRLDSLKEVGG